MPSKYFTQEYIKRIDHIRFLMAARRLYYTPTAITLNGGVNNASKIHVD